MSIFKQDKNKGFSNDEKKILTKNDWQPSAIKPNTYVDKQGDWVKRTNNITNFGGVTKNAGISKSLFDTKTKKGK